MARIWQQDFRPVNRLPPTNEKIRLADQGALYTVKEGAVTILNKEYYDDEKGIQTSPGFMPIQFA